jgi:Zn-dependent peptidase ImmA (M78 family)
LLKTVGDTTFLVLGVFGLFVYEVRMPDGIAARTDGVDIWVDDRLNDVQRKCAIEHELEHVRRGHSTVQPEAEEMSVRYAVSKILLPDENLRPGGPRCSGRTLAARARNLGVTRQVLMDRAATLTDAQAEAVGCLDCRLCPVIAARFPARVSVDA